jgi:16S rRNA (guanine527-N7)-methyltransferase
MIRCSRMGLYFPGKSWNFRESSPTIGDAPFCRVGGKIILFKKGDLGEELAQAKRAAGQVGAVLKEDVAVTLLGLEDSRRLLVWEQAKKCPAQVPRSGATIAKRPLGGPR